MRMKNRFSRMGTSLLGAMCLLSTCGVTYSCSDDYDLDETKPDFLKGSIYDELKARNFNTVVRLIDDLNYTDVLSRTGSKTLFVADDQTYQKFFASNDWVDATGQPVRTYEQLTTPQKRMLLYGAMLNNADVLEMLPYSNDGGSLTMRRSTSASAIDSVPYWKNTELPDNLNVPTVDADGNDNGDKRFWDYYRQHTPGIYMALDGSSPMMIHFLEEQMKAKDITHEDISFVLNLHHKGDTWLNGSAGGKRAYIYGAKIIEQDETCLNGYFNVLDTVLITPSNMAEVIRTNNDTKLFSQMLDRFSAPYYNSTLTNQYKQLYDIGNDSVFEKRYISQRSSTGLMTIGPDKKDLGDYPYLTYDPGWNQYEISTTTPAEQDMGAMFVPTDRAMIDYFVNGAGRVLMDRYATQPNTAENLSYNLYQIPLDIVQSLVNNLMKDSFLESVPSKYLTIMNDAQDQMFPATNADYASPESYKSCIEKCLLANNGVVYVMNRVMSPADYASVIAPALYSKNTRVVRSIVRADDNYIEGNSYNRAPLRKYYSTYLKAMQSHFSFFVPTDDGLGSYGYVDPMSIARGQLMANNFRYWRFTYKNSSSAIIPVRAQAYKYNQETGQNPQNDAEATLGGKAANLSEPNGALSTGPGAVKRTLLIDLIDQHIVVHDTKDEDNDEGINSNRTIFLSRGGAPVFVLNKGNRAENGVGMIVNGGFQKQLKEDAYPGNEHECVVDEGYDMTERTNGYGNGMTYLIDRPMQPTTKTVYSVLEGMQENDFFTLCNEVQFSEDQLILAGFKTAKFQGSANESLWKAEQKKYRIFTTDGVNAPISEKLVNFLNNYRYTVYVPTNDALAAARQKGLKTYDEIIQWMEDHLEGGDGTEGSGSLSPENQAKAQAMITTLMNFIKYHFQDESLFVDNVNLDGTYQTSCLDNVNNVYIPLTVKQTNGKITVTDKNNETQDVVAPYNMVARDADFDKSPSATATQIKNSSFVALHAVNKVLNFQEMPASGRYDDAWATESNARAFVKKYRIR